ncbi:MAG: hypothetical protein OXH45_03670 [Gammaproteobacteria bacterium]|nr:hypothetical protein [Gammaproteobacteria bacterium]
MQTVRRSALVVGCPALNLEVFAERMGAMPGAEPAYGIVINARGGF